MGTHVKITQQWKSALTEAMKGKKRFKDHMAEVWETWAIGREALSVLCRIALCNCYGAQILIQFSSSEQPRKSSGRKSQLKKRWRLQYCPIRHLHVCYNAPYLLTKVFA